MQSISDYYEKLAATYDHDRFATSYGRYVNRMEREILGLWLVNRSAESTVELACGTGRLLDFAMTGVDISPGMLEQARSKWSGRKLIHAEAAATGLPSSSFDAAICFHLLMHLDATAFKAILREAARLVKPGGSFIFDIPSKLRRNLSGRQASGWHGDNAASITELELLAGDNWRLKRWRGILFFPIHRIPSQWRQKLAALDGVIGQTPLARCSSYYVCELERV